METFSASLVFVRGIHRSPVNSPHKGQWRGALMFSMICVWKKNGWENNGEAGDLRRYRAHYGVTVMIFPPTFICVRDYDLYYYIVVNVTMWYAQSRQSHTHAQITIWFNRNSYLVLTAAYDLNWAKSGEWVSRHCCISISGNNSLIVSQWRHGATYILVNIGSGQAPETPCRSCDGTVIFHETFNIRLCNFGCISEVTKTIRHRSDTLQSISIGVIFVGRKLAENFVLSCCDHTDRLVPDCCFSISNALEILQSCAKPPMQWNLSITTN